MKIMLSLVFLFISLLVRSQDFIEWVSSQYGGDTCKEYGLLYNWFAATDGRNISSDDAWIVADTTVFSELATYLGGQSIAGGKLKEEGLINWNSPNEGATNEVGFSAIGGGFRNNGDYQSLKDQCHIWLQEDNYANGYSFRATYSDESISILSGSAKQNGHSIRLYNPTTALSEGQTGTYTQNNGSTIPTIVINGVEWTMNISETLFRNGDVIPSHGLDNDSTFTDTEWSELTYAGTCAYNDSLNLVACGFSFPEFEYANSKYGYLYNWYVVAGDSLSSSADWIVPTYTDIGDLVTYLGGSSVAGGKLKESGYTYWDSPNDGADNSSLFNARGSGYRNTTGTYINILSTTIYWTQSTYSTYSRFSLLLSNQNDDATYGTGSNIWNGFSIRLLYTGAGNPTTYTGNDGKVYKVVKIGTQYWLSENLCETKYRLGSTIPTVTNNTTWSGLTTGAKCAYNNDENNVR